MSTPPAPPDPRDALLARVVSAWRDDVARPAADGLSARVLAAARRGGDDDVRFRRVARVYAAAAVALLAVGVGGTLVLRRVAPPRSAPRLDDLESERLARELAVTIDAQRVGGR